MKTILAFLATTFIMLPTFAYVDVVGPDQFAQELKSAKPVIVMLLTTQSCGFCREQEKILDKVEAKFKNKATFIRIDLDKNPGMVKPSGTPAILLGLAGLTGPNHVVMDITIGLQTEAKLTEKIEFLVQ